VDTIAQLAQHVKRLVDDFACAASQSHPVILRHRKFSACTLASTFILGFLRHPPASDEQLAQMAGTLGVNVTTQAVEQRYTQRLADFLQELFRHAIQVQMGSQQTLAPLLERFTDVELQDSSVVSLPEEMASSFPGHGGDASAAGLKLQTRWSLKTGVLKIQIEPGRQGDLKSSMLHDVPAAGTLRLKDLGYFNTSVLLRIHQEKAYFLTPLPVGVNVYDRQEGKINLLKTLPKKGEVLDAKIQLGHENRVPARLLAWRVPDHVVQQRRQRLKKKAAKRGRKVTTEQWERCQWTVLVTNVPVTKLTPPEARVLYRARWQIELLFKRWKSLGRVADTLASSTVRSMVQLWSRLLAAVLQQWLQTSVWGRAEISLYKAWELIRSFAVTIATVLHNRRRLIEVLHILAQTASSTIRQNPRKHPSTFELLNDPERLAGP